MVDLKGKIALVTGASRGIGRSVAIQLAQAGVAVAINYRIREQEAQLTLEHIASLGCRAIVVQADVSQSSDVSRMVRTVEREIGPVDILVNNAGMARYQTLEEITEGDWDELLAVNLKSVFLVTQAILPGMRGRHWGRIINISSGASQTGGAVGLHYTASKAGMEGLTRAYASRLLKEGITVNAIAPVQIDTDMFWERENAKIVVPLGRLGQTEEVAEAVIFLAQNAYITGQTIHLNGGLYFR